MTKKGSVITLLACSVLALSACSGGTGTNSSTDKKEAAQAPSQPTNPQPVELVFYGAGFSEEPFMAEFGQYIKAKFPHITVKFIRTDPDVLAGMVASGAQMDVQLSVDFQMKQNMIDFGLNYDHAELIKKNSYDTGKLNASSMQLLSNIGGGKVYGLPIYLTVPGLLYNKDLFDKFGTPYPKDGITWDESYEMAKKLTRSEGGINYRGLIAAFQALTVHNQLSLSYVDPKSNKALFVANNSWQKHVETLTRFYKIPGNEVDSKTAQGAALNTAFYKDKVAAMFATVPASSVFATNPTLNMDIATLPTYPDLPGVSGTPSAGVFGVSALSKHKDEAFQVLMYLTSKEYQLERSKQGAISVLSNDADVRKAFGTADAALKGKNIQALSPSRFAPPGKASDYDHIALPQIVKSMTEVAIGSQDVNTALRTADEATEKAIGEYKAKQVK
ncbi:MAG: extracellular solute-binding protein family 1 [Paenibacillus sp.]|jgi:multiple sugar transport system substrate-binding protein|nr:extracellular solute-binding protein family 1 [Paenibacillus sp.]